jgi:hypothetical protein
MPRRYSQGRLASSHNLRYGHAHGPTKGREALATLFPGWSLGPFRGRRRDGFQMSLRATIRRAELARQVHSRTMSASGDSDFSAPLVESARCTFSKSALHTHRRSRTDDGEWLLSSGAQND